MRNSRQAHLFFSMIYHSNNLLLDSRQAPTTPAFACSFDNTTAESLLTRFKEYLRMAVLMGCKI